MTLSPSSLRVQSSTTVYINRLRGVSLSDCSFCLLKSFSVLLPDKINSEEWKCHKIPSLHQTVVTIKVQNCASAQTPSNTIKHHQLFLEFTCFIFCRVIYLRHVSRFTWICLTSCVLHGGEWSCVWCVERTDRLAHVTHTFTSEVQQLSDRSMNLTEEIHITPGEMCVCECFLVLLSLQGPEVCWKSQLYTNLFI